MTYTLTSTSGSVAMEQSSNTTTTAAPMPIDVNALIREMWDRANNDDCDGIDFSAASDQWWGVKVRCQHGEWRGVSNGPCDLATAFLRVRDQFIEGHGASA